jgi:hypothetical protein
MSYDMIDRFLRNNLDDDNYAKYSAALDELCTAPAQRTWVGLTLEDMETTHWSPDFRAGAKWAAAKLKEKNK